MSWVDFHRVSEGLAEKAHLCVRAGDSVGAGLLFGEAANFEERALQFIGAEKPRTYGVTAVSAVALYWKSGAHGKAALLAKRLLNSNKLPRFAVRQIEEILKDMKPEDVFSDIQPIEGVPSVFTYGRTPAGRIGVVAGPQSLPWFEHPTSEADHRKFLEASRAFAQRLAKDVRDKKFHNVRPDYADALNHYVSDLPMSPGTDNFILADVEMRNLRTLFEADAAELPPPFASRLRTMIEQHMALRPFYPEIERLYEAVSRGRIAAPLPLDALSKIDRIVAEHTPDIFEPEVLQGFRELERALHSVEPPTKAKGAVDGVIMPPPDPIAAPSPARTRDFERASAINRLAAAVKAGDGIGKGIDGWSHVWRTMSDNAPAVIDWLKSFLPP